MTEPELLQAHERLTPILASLAITWHLAAKNEQDSADLLVREADRWYESLAPDERIAANAAEEKDLRHVQNLEKMKEHKRHSEVFRSLAASADKGILALTQVERDNPDRVPYLPGAVVAMAEATGRFKLIG